MPTNNDSHLWTFVDDMLYNLNFCCSVIVHPLIMWYVDVNCVHVVVTRIEVMAFLLGVYYKGYHMISWSCSHTLSLVCCLLACVDSCPFKHTWILCWLLGCLWSYVSMQRLTCQTIYTIHVCMQISLYYPPSTIDPHLYMPVWHGKLYPYKAICLYDVHIYTYRWIPLAPIHVCI